MTTDKAQRGFVKCHRSRFYVDFRQVSAESYFATDRLLREISLLKHEVSGHLLDIGCGTKPYGPLLSGHIARHTGVDLPSSIHDQSAVDAYAGATSLPFRSGAFDSVLCTEVLEHVPDPRKAMEEISRVLRPGGTVLLTTPFMYRVHEAPYDFFRYTPFAITALAESAGLEVTAMRTRGGYLSVACDVVFKGLAVLVSAANAALRRWLPGRRHLLHTQTVKILFFACQWLPAMLLRRENLKSDTYTLGYVTLLRKPGQADNACK